MCAWKFQHMEFTFEELHEDDLAIQVSRQCKVQCPQVGIKVHPGGTVLPQIYKQFAKRIHDFEVRKDDIWLVSFPKCGTHWMTELLWLLINLNNFEDALYEKRMPRFSFLEYAGLGYPTNELEELEMSSSQRLIKSHLPMELLPEELWSKKPKVLYIARNPKDAALSFFYHHKNLYGYSGSLESFLEAFYKDKVLWSPFWNNVLGFWDLRHEDNVLFTNYEDMSEDLAGVIKKTANFLNIKVSAEELEKLLCQLDFSNMKTTMNNILESTGKKESWKSLLREGKPGEGKKRMSPEMETNFDKWTKENLLGSDFNIKALMT